MNMTMFDLYDRLREEGWSENAAVREVARTMGQDSADTADKLAHNRLPASREMRPAIITGYGTGPVHVSESIARREREQAARRAAREAAARAA